MSGVSSETAAVLLPMSTSSPFRGGEAVSELLNYTNLLGAVVGCGSLHSPAAQRLSVNHHGAMEERAGSRAVPLARCRRSSSWRVRASG